MTCPVSPSVSQLPRPQAGSPSSPHPRPRMFPAPQQFLLSLSPAPPARRHCEHFPSHSWLCSLPRETGCTWNCFPEGRGRQEPSHVSGCVWEPAVTLQPPQCLHSGWEGPWVPDLTKQAWEALSTQRWSQPDLSATWARLVGCLLGNQGI